MPSVKDKVVWLTGASSGIGEALAYELAAQGARLILSARRKDELARVKGNCRPESQSGIRILPLDLSAADTLRLSAEAAMQMFGRLDVLIHNGGIGQRSLAAETSMAVDRKLMEVNYFGAMALTKYVLPEFVKQKRGLFVIISSLAGKFGTPYRSGYAASKHALHGFFESVRAEHYRDNIRVTIVCPGFIESDLTMSALTANGEPLNRKPQRYKGKPADWCARKIVRAMEKEKEEVYVGGRELLGVFIKRFFPRIFSRVIRNLSMR